MWYSYFKSLIGKMEVGSLIIFGFRKLFILFGLYSSTIFNKIFPTKDIEGKLQRTLIISFINGDTKIMAETK